MKTLLYISLVVAIAACGPSSNAPDANTGSDDGNTSPIDAFGGPKFGEECTTSADCGEGGYCVDGTNNDICTYSCDEGCPEGWNCRITDTGGVLVSLCLPQKFDFCKPCSADVQCNGGICVQLDGSGYCLPQCPFEGQCPTGYSCAPDPTGSHTGNYCVPQTGSCTCTAAQEGQVRTCETTNANGTCYGVETCTTAGGGWGGCTAGTAGMEVCDGMDNDCDQLIDDGVSGSACSNTIAGVGTCPGVQVCTGTSVVCQGKMPALETCNYADDDCDGTPDETYANLSMTCSDGIGGCERFGVYRCNMVGTATECSVTAGSPTAETCNGLDDNCNNVIDDPYLAQLGQPCNVGTGVCARTGNLVCNGAGSGTTCSVQPGMAAPTELCNGLDDDCDTRTDEFFKNPATGLYDQATACGSCNINCTAIYNVANATGVCNTSGAPTCQMQCQPNAFDLDLATANGCELVLDPTAIYVSINDLNGADDPGCGLGPVGTGAGNYPCLTIAQGFVRAAATGRPNIRVANGIYAEAVSLANGKNLLGGHRPDNWQRNVAGTGTVIAGAGTIVATNHDYTVRAVGPFTMATMFEGFVVIGAANAKSAGNSYAIYVSNASASLSIVGNQIYGGRGGPGGSGDAGSTGVAGVNGTGRPSNPSGYDAFTALGTGACNASNNRQHINGGARMCGTDDVSGGNGGGNRCAPMVALEYSGIDGATGLAGDPALGGAGGTGADAGDDSRHFTQMTGPPMPQTLELCTVNAAADYGQDGIVGVDGGNGPAGAGCSAASGSVSGGHWLGGTGAFGTAGGNGGGGGGGGAGAGSWCDTAAGAQCPSGKDNLGGHGGGGGSGGCGGTGGTGATAGGGAFAIFVAGGTAPVITGNAMVRGEGGVGGTGGTGGAGGQGGLGAAGGTSTLFCAGRAGRGGNGGDGGHGAGGGGGCGGSSFGIFTSGVGSPNYCMAAANNTISSGAGGAGGSGGYSLINQGGNGAAGTLGTCQFN